MLYVLDGADNFAIAALTARRLARAGERSGVAPGIVVGIDGGTLQRRAFDYTPAVAGYRTPPARRVPAFPPAARNASWISSRA